MVDIGQGRMVDAQLDVLLTGLVMGNAGCV